MKRKLQRGRKSTNNINISSVNININNNSLCVACESKLIRHGVNPDADFIAKNIGIQAIGNDSNVAKEGGKVEIPHNVKLAVNLPLKELILLFFTFWRKGIFQFKDELSIRAFLFHNFLVQKEGSKGYSEINWSTMGKEFSNLRSGNRREEFSVRNIFRRLFSKIRMDENYDVEAEIEQYNNEICLPKGN